MTDAVAARFDSIRFIAGHPATEWLAAAVAEPHRDLADIAHARGETDGRLLEEFHRRNLSQAPGGPVSARGRVSFVCIEGLEGASALDLIDRLRLIDPSTARIAVVREGMTSEFLRLLGRLQDIRRLMICSPWIHLDEQRHRRFIAAIESSRRSRGYLPELTVVTRPLADQPGPRTIDYIQRVGGVTHFLRNLHSKLYIIEAGDTTISRTAFVGSENFTTVRYQEIGLRITDDNQIIDALIRHFLAYADRRQ